MMLMLVFSEEGKTGRTIIFFFLQVSKFQLIKSFPFFSHGKHAKIVLWFNLLHSYNQMPHLLVPSMTHPVPEHRSLFGQALKECQYATTKESQTVHMLYIKMAIFINR